MQLPFTVYQFYGVFTVYNVSVWPMQWVLVAMALLGVPQDLGLVAAAAVSAVLLFRSKASARNGFSTL